MRSHGHQGPEDVDGTEEFTFTEEDVARFRELTQETSSSSGMSGSGRNIVLDIREASSLEGTEAPVLDLSLVKTYTAIRSGPGATGENLFRVTNEFLNVRDKANVTAASLERLDQGALVKMVELVSAAWAKIEYAKGKEGYVALRYLSKVASEDKLAEEKKAYEGMYFVNFGFVNVRKEPSAQSEKLGRFPDNRSSNPSAKTTSGRGSRSRARKGTLPCSTCRPSSRTSWSVRSNLHCRSFAMTSRRKG